MIIKENKTIKYRKLYFGEKTKKGDEYLSNVKKNEYCKVPDGFYGHDIKKCNLKYYRRPLSKIVRID